MASILDTTLADNGGPTLTHALVSGSPAIDLAPNGAAPGGIDQRGAARDYDGDGLGDTGYEGDSGAYEYRASTQDCTVSVGTPVTVENVTFNFSNMGTLTCVTVDEMGADHLLATGNAGTHLHTGNWWHITGDGTGFSVSITLPYTGADGNTRVCKYPGSLGGYGWDCDDGTNTTNIAGTSVTRSNIGSFSDWAVGQDVGPTAVSVSTIDGGSATPVVGAVVAFVMVFAGVFFILKKFNAFAN